jgi:hypothetical protein
MTRVAVLSRRDAMVGGAALVVGACQPAHPSHPPPLAKPRATPPAETAPPPVSFETVKPFHHFSSDVSNDGRFLAIGAGSPNGEETGGPVAVWDLVARRVVRRRRISGHGLGLVLAGENLLRFTSSNGLLIANTNTNTVTLLDVGAPDLAIVGEFGSR